MDLERVMDLRPRGTTGSSPVQALHCSQELPPILMSWVYARLACRAQSHRANRRSRPSASKTSDGRLRQAGVSKVTLLNVRKRHPLSMALR
jgi:hypothetical protein